MKSLSFILRLLKCLLPAYITFYFLIKFPYNIFLDRDLQYHGKIVTGSIVDFKILKGKRDKPYRSIKIDYISSNKKYSKWFNNETLEIGKNIEIYYSPVSPSHSILLKDKPQQYPWNQNLIFRLLIAGFIGLIFGGITITFFNSDTNY